MLKSTNLHPEQASSFGNENFCTLGNFERIKELITNQEQNKNINQELDLWKGQREKLNEQIKTTFATKISQKDPKKSIVKIKAHDQTKYLWQWRSSFLWKRRTGILDKSQRTERYSNKKN